ncbi:hypothetical protein ILUMI_07081 [Ignelater luminosus]|uniref:Uncharacterized protein n=1 Tax=Ignelater luminosus TaxID=2038154 RepID=A0A8K0D9Y3_IGNLU|nr:hypothetical protein ILUMI_07081 [Ignelater luminosus]
MADKRNMLLMYDRPLEPLFKQKGESKTAFNLPAKFYTERYKSIGVNLGSRFQNEANDVIDVQDIPVPDLSGITNLARDENFSLFIPKHRNSATNLINLFMGAKNLDEFQSLAAYCRDRVNPYLFNYCLSVAILHRPDTKDMDIPSLMEVFPDKYVDSQVFQKAREESYVVDEGSRVPIEIPVDYTASSLENEHRIAYFTEDLGVNAHHWHWHLVYPFSGPMEIVNKDRRGELFFYFHHQLMARYNVERLCNGLARVRRLTNYREAIPESYYPKLDSLVANRTYPGRPSGMVLQDVNRERDQWKIDIQDFETARDRVFEAIQETAYLDANGIKQPLTEYEGIDILGNIIEASSLTPNRNYYGDWHNYGHSMLGVIHDPDLRHLESFGTIGDPATSMRDPIFYPFHAAVNDTFLKFKATIPRYTTAQLGYDGVTVTSCAIQSQNVKEPNMLNTFWQQSDVDMSRGLDFQPRGSVFVRFTHLQHQPFNYVIKVNNAGGARQGTCRIFIGPKFDESGNPMLLINQKDLLIEMDRFIVNLSPGENIITQASTQSSLTIPFERTFRNLELGRPTGGAALEQFNFCGCGWPQHLLIPKGTPEGYACEMFVMISDIAGDRVDQSIEGQCSDASVYCGIRDRKYPDRRSMGYPFDRVPRDGVDTLEKFLTPNMRVQDVTIRHFNRTVRPKRN